METTEEEINEQAKKYHLEEAIKWSKIEIRNIKDYLINLKKEQKRLREKLKSKKNEN